MVLPEMRNEGDSHCFVSSVVKKSGVRLFDYSQIFGLCLYVFVMDPR